MIILQGLNTCDRCATIYRGKKVKKKEKFYKNFKNQLKGIQKE